MSDRPSSIIDLTADSDDGQGQVDADETLARRLQKAVRSATRGPAQCRLTRYDPLGR